ncbi:plasmid stabilization system protein ParE [Pseudomonas viridiflava]
MPAANSKKDATANKDKYTDKQKRKAEHIEEGYEEKGVSKGEAEARAWATVNKQSGGGERKGGSGTRTPASSKSAASRAQGFRQACRGDQTWRTAQQPAAGVADQSGPDAACTRLEYCRSLDHEQAGADQRAEESVITNPPHTV